MSASYQPLPTDDRTNRSRTSLSPRKRPKASFLVFLAVSLFLVGVPTYNAFHRLAADRDQALIGKIPEIQNTTVAVNQTEMSQQGKYSVGYFVNWGIYGRKFPPSLIPAEDLTHILYAFANVKSETGEVFLSDLWADQDIHYPGDSWDDTSNNLYGNFNAIYKLKQQHRHLKVILSIGGWTYSPSFHPVVVDASRRARFVESAVQLLEDYALDGLDVDYEYPQNDEQARGYVALLHELRHALDQHARNKGIDYRFLLTIAAPCGPDNYKKLHAAEMDRALDFWNMMSYDFSGSWDQIANHQANVFGGLISAAEAINWYIAQGVPRHKIIMGIPLYGRSFMNTRGPGHPFSGVGAGSWEQGVYDYRALPLPNSQVFHDERALASWSFDPAKGEMVSFDTAQVGWWKGEYIAREGLGGSMFWELSGDKGSPREGMEKGEGKDEVPGDSLVRTVKQAMGGLDHSPNWLRYERSKFKNIANGGTGGGANPTPPITTATDRDGSQPRPSIAPWSPSAVYTGGMTCTHAGYVWTAKWWTQGETPGPNVDVWAQGAAV